MIELGAASGVATVVALVVVSFFSFVAGVILRKWPDTVQAFAEDLDGFSLLLTPEAQRALIVLCGHVLVLLSFVALLAAATVA